MKKNRVPICTPSFDLHDSRAGVRYPMRSGEIRAACDRWLASRGIHTEPRHPFKSQFGKKSK